YDQDVFDELQNGTQVTFRAQNDDYIFDLSQSRAALNRLLNCFDQYSKQASTNPFGGGSGASDQQNGGGQGSQQDASSNNQQQNSSGDSNAVRLASLTQSADDVQQFLVDVTGA